MFLAYLSYPAFKRSPRERVPITDWVLALVGAYCAAYLFLLSRNCVAAWQPTDMDIYTAVVGMVLCLKRRAACWVYPW